MPWAGSTGVGRRQRAGFRASRLESLGEMAPQQPAREFLDERERALDIDASGSNAVAEAQMAGVDSSERADVGVDHQVDLEAVIHDDDYCSHAIGLQSP